jgi:hypothetical protein
MISPIVCKVSEEYHPRPLLATTPLLETAALALETTAPPVGAASLQDKEPGPLQQNIFLTIPDCLSSVPIRHVRTTGLTRDAAIVARTTSPLYYFHTGFAIKYSAAR